MAKVPKRYRRFQEEYPSVADAYEYLRKAIHTIGPLSPKERALVKVAISVGAGMEGGVHSHTRKALMCGVKKDDLKHVALLAIQTIGFPSAMEAMSWIDDIIAEKPKKRKKR